jgi:hypothetical protein
MWLSPTFNGVSARFQTEAIPVLRHSSAHDQWWEHPDDSLITSGSCETACADSPASSYVGDERPQSYADAKYACESFNGCNSTWTETQQVIDNSGNLWDLSTSRPQRLPRGWRVDSAGHLTNLPFGLDVTSATALERGVAIIRPAGMQWNITMPCIFYADADENYQFSESECAGRGYAGTDITVEHLSWAISEGEKSHRDFGGEGQLYWWLETPTFTASCSDPNSPGYSDTAHYWDDTLCQDSQSSSGGSTTSTSGTEWGGLIAAGFALTAMTVAATVYGGRI